VNVFVPLVDVTEELGPTEFWLGSQASGRHEECCRAAARGAELPDHPQLRIAAAAGDAIVFDWRIVHRGCANVGAVDRPVFYLTFARAWWADAAKPGAPSLLHSEDDALFEYALANAVKMAA
jgi:ectoine hydroxylase-related dioxygenase (phytanoyl-CoA dioxygenase family)